MMEGLTDWLYPPRCVLCDEVLPLWEGDAILPGRGKKPGARTAGGKASRGLCQHCQGGLRYLSEPCCMKCGKEIEDEEMEYCRDCREHVRSYEKGFPLFHYVPPVSDSVLAMKYKNRQEYAAFYGGELARQFGASFRQLGIQVMIPIPLHKKRLRQRGYNQAELLARAMEKELAIPVETDLLFRTGATRPQKELGDEERVRNLHAAFSVKEGKTVPERVLLVDDIYTTGSTIEACTRVLKDHGARQVYYTSICIGKV